MRATPRAGASELLKNPLLASLGGFTIFVVSNSRRISKSRASAFRGFAAAPACPSAPHGSHACQRTWASRWLRRGLCVDAREKVSLANSPSATANQTRWSGSRQWRGKGCGEQCGHLPFAGRRAIPLLLSAHLQRSCSNRRLGTARHRLRGIRDTAVERKCRRSTPLPRFSHQI